LVGIDAVAMKARYRRNQERANVFSHGGVRRITRRLETSQNLSQTVSGAAVVLGTL
jgi:hypothetical protein